MPSFTRIHGLKTTVGKLSLLRIGAYKVTVKNAGNTAIDLRGEDDAVDETVEQIIKELNPASYFIVDGADGIMYITLDRSYQGSVFDDPTTAYDAERNTDVAELQIRIRRIGKDFGTTTTSIGPNDIDISGTVVEEAVSMTFGV
jgi:hypothetical protein